MRPYAVHLRDVVFGYTASPALLQIKDLRIEEGKRVFLYGPSGSGKTTLLGLIAGILQPQSGNCEVLGKDCTKLSVSARDEHRGAEMGYIFQSFNLIPYLSARQNIELPCRVHTRRRKRITSATLAGEVERIAKRLEIDTVLERAASQLSAGQQQRVAIARAVIGKPALIVADEPTSSLDAERRDRFVDLLFEVSEKDQTTLVFVSHDLALSSRFDEQISLRTINRLGAQDTALNRKANG